MDLKILIRFDDICPTMDFTQFNRAIELMDKYNVKPLIGVIPLCKDKDLQIEEVHEDFWEYVKALRDKGYSIAMHGYEHVFCSQHHGMVNRRIGSEFAGLPLEQQRVKIKKGKEIFKKHGIETDVFFAPAHSYDLNTLKALADNGFKYVSDGKSNKAYIFNGVKCLPCRNGGAADIKGNGYYTSVFHAHEWAREDKAYAYEQLEATLASFAPYIVSFEDYCQQPTGNTFLQRIDEQVYVLWQCEIKSCISKIYHKIFRG